MATNIRKTPIDRNEATRALIKKVEEAMIVLHKLSIQSLGHLRAQLEDTSARAADDDDWRRMPPNTGRCAVSGWSRATIERYAKINRVRKKKVGGSSYYAAKDVRDLLNEQTAPPSASK